MSGWRLIESEPGGAFYNMALDEALAHSVGRGEPPVLRLFTWETPSVSIGRFQEADSLDLQYLEAQKIPYVRRITGGRGILHDVDLTYSFSSPASSGALSGSLRESYTMLGLTFMRAFQTLGLMPEMSSSATSGSGRRSPLCFESASVGELKIEGKKVVGSAQKRFTEGYFMQQGSIPLKIDYAQQGRVFGVGPEEQSAMAGLCESIPGLSREELKEALVESFETVFEMKFDRCGPDVREESEARDLERKYAALEWNLNKQFEASRRA